MKFEIHIAMFQIVQILGHRWYPRGNRGICPDGGHWSKNIQNIVFLPDNLKSWSLTPILLCFKRFGFVATGGTPGEPRNLSGWWPFCPKTTGVECNRSGVNLTTESRMASICISGYGARVIHFHVCCLHRKSGSSGVDSREPWWPIPKIFDAGPI